MKISFTPAASALERAGSSSSPCRPARAGAVGRCLSAPPVCWLAWQEARRPHARLAPRAPVPRTSQPLLHRGAHCSQRSGCRCAVPAAQQGHCTVQPVHSQTHAGHLARGIWSTGPDLISRG